MTERGFDNRWVLFVREKAFYREQLAFDPYEQPNPAIDPTSSVSYLRLADLERYPELPLLEFDKNGRAVAWGAPARDYFKQCIKARATKTANLCKDGAILEGRTTISSPDNG